MSFVVREITKRADGGEIVRARALAADEIVVGRGTDCDVQVQDLAVLLRHARLRRVGDGRVFVESMSGVPIEIDGRFGNRGEIRPGSQSVVTLGGHRLTIAAPTGAGEVAITVERVAPLSDAAREEDESRIFTLSHTVPSKRRTAWLAALLVLVAFLAYPVSAYLTDKRGVEDRVVAMFQPDQSWSSGPLSSAHANLDGECASCHQKAFTAVQDGACISCHKGIADHSTPSKLAAAHADMSFQGKLRQLVGGPLGLKPWTCTTCHKEHEGPGPMPIGFDTDCASCHTDLSKRVASTDLGDASDFKEKHPNFRPYVVALPAPGGTEPMLQRVSLDGKPTENSGLKFPHDMHLSTSNGVARMARQVGGRYDGPLDCGDCHQPDRTGVGLRPIEMERDCASCHSLDFARADGMIRTLRHGDPAQAVAELRDFYRVARPIEAVDRRRPGLAFTATRPAGPGGAEAKIRAIFQEGGACYDCHVVRPPASPGSLAFNIAPVSLADRYLAKGWFDHRDHETAESPCSTCHAAKTSKLASDVLLPGIGTCRECHAGDNPHGDEIASPCSSCHSYHEGPGAPRSAGSKATVTAARNGAAKKG